MKMELKVEEILAGHDELTLVEWGKNPGETFVAGETLYSVETGKAHQEVEAPCAGQMLEVRAAAGDKVMVGTVICVIEAE